MSDGNQKPVKKGKQSRQGQAERREAIVRFIRENGPVKSGVLCKALGLSRSSLSDDINAINAQGEIIRIPMRGYYEYQGAGHQGTENQGAEDQDCFIRGTIDRAFVRRWMILAILSGERLTFSELQESLEEYGIFCSEGTLHADLQELRRDNYVHAGTEQGSTIYRSDRIYAADREEIRRFHRRSTSGQAAGAADLGGRTALAGRSGLIVQSFEEIEKKLIRIDPAAAAEDAEAGGAADGSVRYSGASQSGQTYSSGRKNILTRKQLMQLAEFEKLPYRERRLLLACRPEKGDPYSLSFCTGMVVYSMETSRIYLLGKTGEEKNHIIPLDQVDLAKTREDSTDGDGSPRGQNRHFESREFQTMFQQMLHVSVEDPVHVAVRFQDLPFIREKVERLHRIRRLSKITPDPERQEFLYTDEIRGIDDFARYLRRFGRSALVMEPEVLRERLIRTSRWVTALYEEEGNDGPV